MESFLVSAGAGILVAVLWELVWGRRQHQETRQMFEKLYQAAKEGHHVHVEMDGDRITEWEMDE